MNLELLVARVLAYRRRDLLVDANLLLLLFVGAWRSDRIRSFKRTSSFTIDDFMLLETFVSHFKRMTTTPHILTEVSNLMGQGDEPLRTELRGLLAEALQEWKETSQASRILVRAQSFLSLGLADTAIAEMTPGSCLVLTDDHPLAGFLETRRIDVIRFSDLQATCL